MTNTAIENEDDLITVCDNCGRSSCWHYEFVCADYVTAGTKEMKRSELDKLKLEHPSYYSKEKLKLICGE